MCRENKPLCNAHLVPRSFGKWIAEDNSFMEISENRKRKAQTLQFDKNILCSDCDNKLGEFDDDLINFCIKVYDHPKRKELYRPKAKSTEIIMNLDENTLSIQLGIIATLWRCSISKQYLDVDLGDKYNLLFRDWLCLRNIPDYDKYLCETLLISFIEDDIDKYILPPAAKKVDGYFISRFQVPGMEIIAKIGNGLSFKQFGPLLLDQADTVKLLILPDNKKIMYKIADEVRN